MNNKVRNKKIRFISVIAVFITFMILSTSTLFADSGVLYNVKVGLKFGANAPASSRLYSKYGFKIGYLHDRTFNNAYGSTDSKNLTVNIISGSIIVKDSSMNLVYKGGEVCIMPNSPDEGMITIDGTTYRGGVYYKPNKYGSMNIINYLNVESYVYGVIYAEMGNKYPLEALKAQAVCARSYVVNSKSRFKEEGFDVCTTSACQSYKGVAGEYPVTNQSVDETKGEILYYNNSPIVGYYFANSGGHTLNSEDVWYERAPYLRAVQDEFSPEYKWTYKVNRNELGRKLGIGTVTTINIKEKTAYGSVNTIEFVGSNGTKTLKKDGIRTTLGAGNVKSRIFTINAENAGGGGNIKSSNLYGISKDGTFLMKDIFMINGAGNIVSADLESTQITDGNNSVPLKTLTKTGNIQTPQTGGSIKLMSPEVIFTGYGYGHGVGMPQQSAKYMALKGNNYKQILQKYFTGANVAPMR